MVSHFFSSVELILDSSLLAAMAERSASQERQADTFRQQTGLLPPRRLAMAGDRSEPADVAWTAPFCFLVAQIHWCGWLATHSIEAQHNPCQQQNTPENRENRISM
jgi:hypothetical protein